MDGKIVDIPGRLDTLHWMSSRIYKQTSEMSDRVFTPETTLFGLKSKLLYIYQNFACWDLKEVVCDLMQSVGPALLHPASCSFDGAASPDITGQFTMKTVGPFMDDRPSQSPAASEEKSPPECQSLGNSENFA